jgi:hypothetical protein
MIRIILRGRTGNIMFQYALGRVLAAKHRVPLLMDASWYNRQGWSEVSHFLKLPLRAKVIRRFSLASRALRNYTGKHYWQLMGVPLVKEPTHDQSFNPRFLDAPSDCMISGFFQSPRYFESMAKPLREEIKSLLTPFSDRLSCPPLTVGAIRQANSIAVHVRRGDYLQNPVFDVCGESYYRRSMDAMRERVPDARFYIFSDDPEWCRETFTGMDTEIVTATDKHRHNPLHDLHLISLASHHIIANSSYSWWAAWLGDKPGQQVIMPDRWFSKEIHAPIEEKWWK